MGKDEVEPSDHSPAHAVSLDDFWIFRAEVTNRMYRACVDLGTCTEPEDSPWYAEAARDNGPVSGVTWEQARVYCEWIGGRLPTEAEWELAARGTDGRTYPWGEDKPECDLLNFLGCLDPSVPEAIGKHPLGASPFNALDMAGNISEWVGDWYEQDYYAHSPSSNPTGPESGEERVVRGSSYLSPEEANRLVLRRSQDPSAAEPSTGFRCVIDPGTQRSAPLCNAVGYEPAYYPTYVPRPSPAGQATNFGFYCDAPSQVRGIVKFDFDVYQYAWTHPMDWTPAAPAVQVQMLDQQPDRVEVYGDAIQPGQQVTIEFCFPADLPDPVPIVCPAFYQYDPGSGQCRYGEGYGGEDCLGGLVVEGYGCLWHPMNGQCPPGHYKGDYNGEPVCIPASGPICLDPDLPPAVCPEGLTFHEGNICCESPGPVAPACPSGFTLDAPNAQCVPEPQEWCTSISGTAPLCEPTPTPDKRVGCWIVTVGPPICTYPCPGGVPNNGPCTP
jgi:hypothetical protein